MTAKQLDVLAPPRPVEVPAQTPGSAIQAERARYYRDQVATTHWYLLYMLALGLFGAVVVLMGAELW